MPVKPFEETWCKQLACRWDIAQGYRNPLTPSSSHHSSNNDHHSISFTSHKGWCPHEHLSFHSISTQNMIPSLLSSLLPGPVPSVHFEWTYNLFLHCFQLNWHAKILFFTAGLLLGRGLQICYWSPKSLKACSQKDETSYNDVSRVIGYLI